MTAETTRNHTQRDFGFIAPVRDVVPADRDKVALCKTEAQAAALCIALSGDTYETIGEKCGMRKGTVSKVAHGRAPIPANKRLAFMRACGNYAPLQYEAMKAGFALMNKSAFEEAVRAA